jgi:hypothetical protein
MPSAMPSRVKTVPRFSACGVTRDVHSDSSTLNSTDGPVKFRAHRNSATRRVTHAARAQLALLRARSLASATPRGKDRYRARVGSMYSPFFGWPAARSLASTAATRRRGVVAPGSAAPRSNRNAPQRSAVLDDRLRADERMSRRVARCLR